MTDETGAAEPTSASVRGPRRDVAPMSRDEFVRRQRILLDEAFTWTSDEEALRERFENLALETYERLAPAIEHIGPFAIDARSFLDFIDYHEAARELLRPDLLGRWLAWRDEFDGLLERNPRLFLHDALHLIARSFNDGSWPQGLEPAISDWIDGGQRESMPFDDRYGIVTPEFYDRLQDVRRRAGGFLFWSDEEKRVLFLPEPQWQRQKAAMVAREAERRRRMEDRFARAMRLQRRVDEIVTAARSDATFWDALRAWEIAREAKRPKGETSALNPPSRLSGPIAIRKVDRAISREKSVQPPMDDLFAAFLSTVRRSADEADSLSLPWIVAMLRKAVRDELGLDGVMTWPGGPGICEQ